MRVQAGKLSAQAETFRMVGSEWNREIVMLSMTGPRNAVRGIWARLNLVSGRRRYESLETPLGSARLGDNVYVSLSAPLPRGGLHLIAMHRDMTHHLSPYETRFYQLGKETFFARLNRVSPVPFKREWANELFDRGIAAGLVKSCPGIGREVFGVDASSLAWLDVVKELL